MRGLKSSFGTVAPAPPGVAPPPPPPGGRRPPLDVAAPNRAAAATAAESRSQSPRALRGGERESTGVLRWLPRPTRDDVGGGRRRRFMGLTGVLYDMATSGEAYRRALPFPGNERSRGRVRGLRARVDGGGVVCRDRSVVGGGVCGVELIFVPSGFVE